MFANFDLELGMVGTKHQFVDATITPAANGWFRCAMAITWTEGQGFVIGLVTAEDAIKGQTNALATSILLAFPHMEDGHVTTNYISTSGCLVTRAADIVLYEVAMSLFRVYGVRDLVGPMGRRGLLGVDGPVGLKGDTGEQGIQGLKGDTGEQGIQGLKGDTGDTGPQGLPGSDATVPLWVNATQTNVQLSAFGGTLAASRLTNIDYNSLINKPLVVLPGYLSPIALT